MGKRAFMKKIKSGYHSVFWGSRAYVTVTLKAADIHEVFPDLPACPEQLWAQEGYLCGGLENTFDRENPDGSFDCVSISNASCSVDPGHSVHEGVSPLFMETDEYGTFHWWEGIIYHFPRDPAKEQVEWTSTEQVDPARVKMHKDWHDWTWKNLYGVGLPEDFDEESVPGLFLQFMNVGKAGYVNIDNGNLVFTSALKRYPSQVRGCANICMKLKKNLNVKVTVR